MKKFAFTLQKVLDLRQYTEDQAKMELGRAVSAVNALNGELLAVAQNRGVAMAERASVKAGLLDIRALGSVEHYITLLDAKKDALAASLAQAEQAAAEKRGLYLEAMRNRSVLTKLSERQYAGYKKDLGREEDRLLDEAGSRRAVTPL
ncbi:MAG: flagellar export protein FliJ [Spirochaetaceae bacterium]|jgi:flagellar FliJ protein|nr:flagellar export protein FliJ [Spirochaetaceae bacterium]